MGSFKEWEDYNTALQDVLNWLSQAERTLESQERISDNVDAVKKQFHGHEVGICLCSNDTTHWCGFCEVQIPL